VKLKITVDGKVYEAEVEVSEPERRGPGYYPPLTAQVPASAPGGGAPNSAAPATKPSGAPVDDESKVCRSPLAGTVTRIEAEAGQQIAVNATLLVLEAMKMETVITAPFEGTVKAINASVGDAVQQGEVLVEFD